MTLFTCLLTLLLGNTVKFFPNWMLCNMIVSVVYFLESKQNKFVIKHVVLSFFFSQIKSFPSGSRSKSVILEFITPLWSGSTRHSEEHYSNCSICGFFAQWGWVFLQDSRIAVGGKNVPVETLLHVWPRGEDCLNLLHWWNWVRGCYSDYESSEWLSWNLLNKNKAGGCITHSRTLTSKL